MTAVYRDSGRDGERRLTEDKAKVIRKSVNQSSSGSVRECAVQNMLCTAFTERPPSMWPFLKCKYDKLKPKAVFRTLID